MVLGLLFLHYGKFVNDVIFESIGIIIFGFSLYDLTIEIVKETALWWKRRKAEDYVT